MDNFEDPFNWIFCGALFRISFLDIVTLGWSTSRTTQFRLCHPCDGVTTPLLQSYQALVWRYLARVSRSARTAHYLEGTTSGGAVAIRLDLGKRRPGYMPMLDGSSALVIKRPIL